MVWSIFGDFFIIVECVGVIVVGVVDVVGIIGVFICCFISVRNLL